MMASAVIMQDDAVVFARSNPAEILGIQWHARGRAAGLHRAGDAAATVDVKFQWDGILVRYLSNLFRPVL